MLKILTSGFIFYYFDSFKKFLTSLSSQHYCPWTPCCGRLIVFKWLRRLGPPYPPPPPEKFCGYLWKYDFERFKYMKIWITILLRISAFHFGGFVLNHFNKNGVKIYWRIKGVNYHCNTGISNKWMDTRKLQKMERETYINGNHLSTLMFLCSRNLLRDAIAQQIGNKQPRHVLFLAVFTLSRCMQKPQNHP